MIYECQSDKGENPVDKITIVKRKKSMTNYRCYIHVYFRKNADNGEFRTQKKKTAILNLEKCSFV